MTSPHLSQIPGFKALHVYGALRHHDHTCDARDAAILDAALGISAADFASLYLLEPESECLSMAAARETEPATGRSWLDNSLVHNARDSAFSSCERQLVTGDPAHGPVTIQATPLLGRKGQAIGVLLIAWASPIVPSDTQMLLLDLLAWQVADGRELDRAETALLAREARLKTVIAELQHRVRNILAVVRSVFSLTVESGRDFQTTIAHFNGRLDALARTQVIVTRSITGTVDLETMLRDELLGAGVHDGPHVTITGPDVALAPGLAEGVGLALHELTTNSLKFGALSERDASLAISWSIAQPAQGERHLDFVWSESGISGAIDDPHRWGFGRELIEQSLPYRFGARTWLRIDDGQVQCRLLVPLLASRIGETPPGIVP